MPVTDASTPAVPPEKSRSSAGPSGNASKLKWIIALLPLAYLWFQLIDNLQVEWTTNPQYGYGWVVPLLSAGLILRQWPFPPRVPPARGSAFWLAVIAFMGLAFLYLPTRLIEAATPEWRPLQWLLGIETIGLTLCAIYLGGGKIWLRKLAFPALFFFVAIPWPSLIEQPIIQTLTRMSAAIVTEVLTWMDIPTIVHGNVIEVSTGVVGIDEACSGIRSFQSSLMISLFLGEFYSLSRWRRGLLIPAGFIVSMIFNVGRMGFLTFVAAKKGVGAIAEYHDPAGVTIAIVCTLVLWGLAAWFKKLESKKMTQESATPATSAPPSAGLCPASEAGVFGLQILAPALILWLVAVEVGVQSWYRHLESNFKPSPTWTLNFPTNNPTLRDLPIPEESRNLLRYDEGHQAIWTQPDGTDWQVFFCDWLPGRVAGYLAKRHTPEICLQATGLEMVAGPELTIMNINGVDLPIRSYVFQTDNGPIQVFHCRWEAGVESKDYVDHDSTRFNLVRAIWAGRGNKGQKVVEVIISGMKDPEQAKAALRLELEKMVTVNRAG
ncbi:MAG: exosortase/archaeosortase family protein [Limisphaerales bacterium]